MTMSAGPIAGVPAPSTIVALRITSDSARLPDVGACAPADTVARLSKAVVRTLNFRSLIFMSAAEDTNRGADKKRPRPKLQQIATEHASRDPPKASRLALTSSR
jgi:CBS-domain-containing membrane protein